MDPFDDVASVLKHFGLSSAVEIETGGVVQGAGHYAQHNVGAVAVSIPITEAVSRALLAAGARKRSIPPVGHHPLPPKCQKCGFDHFPGQAHLNPVPGRKS